MASSNLRSLSSSENVYVLIGILALTLAFGLTSATRRRGQDRRAAERKRRLLGIPDAPLVASKDSKRTVKPIKNRLYDACNSIALALSLRSRETLGSPASGATLDTAASDPASSSTTESPQRKMKGSRAVSNLGVPAGGNSPSSRRPRGRTTGVAEQPGSSQGSSSTSPASRKTSRSVSSSFAADQARQRDRVNLPNKPITRSIAIQYPSDDEEQDQVSEKAVQADRELVQGDIAATTSNSAFGLKAAKALRCPSTANETAKVEFGGGNSLHGIPNGEISPTGKHIEILPEAPTAAGTSYGPAQNISHASSSHSDTAHHREPPWPDHMVIERPDARISGTHPETPRAHQRLDSLSPSQSTFASAGPSREASLSGRSASWSISTDNSASTNLTSPISTRCSSLQEASEGQTLSRAEAKPTDASDPATPYCFHSSFRSPARAEAATAKDGSKDGQNASDEIRQRETVSAIAHLPTPPDSESRYMASSTTDGSSTAYRQSPNSAQPLVPPSYQMQSATSILSPPQSPSPLKSTIAAQTSGESMFRQSTVLPHSAEPSQESSLANDGFPTLYKPSTPSLSGNVMYSSSSSRATSPVPPTHASSTSQARMSPYAAHDPRNAMFLQQQQYRQAQQSQHHPQTPSIEAYQAQQLLLFRNMQAMQTQLQMVQAGLYPASGRISNPGTPLLSPAPNGTWPPATPSILPQASPGLMHMGPMSPHTPVEGYTLAGLHPYAMSTYGNATASTSYGHQANSSGGSTSYPDGTIMEHGSSLSRRRQSSYGDISVSTPPSMNMSGKRKTSTRKYSKGSQGRTASATGGMPHDALGSPSPSARDLSDSTGHAGDESFGYSHARRPSYNSYRRRDSAPSSAMSGLTVSSSSRKADRAEREAEEKARLKENLATLEGLQDDDELDEAGMRTKMKAMEAVLERRGKELEIANWKLKCVEVDRHNTETEHQKALNHFYERAERAEARLKLSDASARQNNEPSSSHNSPVLQFAASLPDSELSDAGIDDRSMRSDAEHVTNLRNSTKILSEVAPMELPSPSSHYASQLGSPNLGPLLRHPPHPFANNKKQSKKANCNRRASSELGPQLSVTDQRTLAPKSSNGSFGSSTSASQGEGEEDGSYASSGSEDEDDLVIVLHSAGRSPNLQPVNGLGQLPASLPGLDEALAGSAIDGPVGLGFTVAATDGMSGNASPEDSDVVAPNYVGSLPSFTFSKPPKSPTRNDI